MSHDADQQKWNRIYSDAEAGGQAPARVLGDNAHLLPEHGEALEVACGMGANAIFLARRGLATTAWDISDVAADKLNDFAANNALGLRAEAVDVMATPPTPLGFDVIVITHYLERDLCPALIEALRPGGLLFYQTFTRETTEQYTGPGNPAFRLAQNELLVLFQDLTVRVYREEGLVGDVSMGLRNEALLVAQKQPSLNR